MNIRRRLAWISIVSLATAVGMAQNNGDEAPGKGDLRVHLLVRVVTTDDRAVARNLTVRLMLESGGGTLSTSSTNSEGVADMTISHAGNYKVEVSGPGVETTASDPFSILKWDMSHQEIVHVRLKGSAAENSTPTGSSMASANNLAVPKDAEKEFDAGVSSMRASDWKGAQAHFQKAIDKYPRFDSAYDNLGMAKQNGGDMAGAKEAYQKALELNDHNADAQRNMGRVYESEKNWPAAEEILTKSLSIEPNNAGSLTLLSIAELEQGKLNEAITHAGRVHSLDHKSYAMAHLVLARAYEMKGEKSNAIAQYQLFLSEEPNGPRSEAAKKRLAKLQAAG
jgi:tetratricopeptide (TPR) repeat protein